MAMKEEILKYFRTDRSYQGAVSLYMRYGNRIGLKKQLNVQEENDHLLNTLHEELRSLAGIDPNVFRVLVSVPIVKIKEEAPVIKEVATDPLPKPVVESPAKSSKEGKKKADPAAPKKKTDQQAQPKKKTAKK